MNKELLQVLAAVTEEEKRFLEGASEINRSIYMENSHNVVNRKKLLDQNKLISVRVHSRFVHFLLDIVGVVCGKELCFSVDCCGVTAEICKNGGS